MTEQSIDRQAQCSSALELTQPYDSEVWAAFDRVLRPAEAWQDIRRQLEDGSMRAWGILNQAVQAVLVGHILETARGKVCRLWVISAQPDQATMAALLEEGETFARDENCAAIEVNTHTSVSGWIKTKLVANGWRQAWGASCKDLSTVRPELDQCA